MLFQRMDFYIFMFLFKNAFSAEHTGIASIQNLINAHLNEIRILLEQKNITETFNMNYNVYNFAVNRFEEEIEIYKQIINMIGSANENKAKNYKKVYLYEKHFATTALFLKEDLSLLPNYKGVVFFSLYLDFDFYKSIQKLIDTVTSLIPKEESQVPQNKKPISNNNTDAIALSGIKTNNENVKIHKKLFDNIFLEVDRLNKQYFINPQRTDDQQGSLLAYSIKKIFETHTKSVKGQVKYEEDINRLYEKVNTDFLVHFNTLEFTNDNNTYNQIETAIRELNKLGEPIVKILNKARGTTPKEAKEDFKDRNSNNTSGQNEPDYIKSYEHLNLNSILEKLELCKLGHNSSPLKTNIGLVDYNFSQAYKITAEKEIDNFFNEHPDYMIKELIENPETFE